MKAGRRIGRPPVLAAALLALLAALICIPTPPTRWA